MDPDPTSLDPGRMTVPPLFGWEHIVVVLALVALVAASWLVLAAARGPVNERSEWHAWLDARSTSPGFPVNDPQERADLIHPSRLAVQAGAGRSARGADEPDPSGDQRS